MPPRNQHPKAKDKGEGKVAKNLQYGPNLLARILGEIKEADSAQPAQRVSHVIFFAIFDVLTTMFVCLSVYLPGRDIPMTRTTRRHQLQKGQSQGQYSSSLWFSIYYCTSRGSKISLEPQNNGCSCLNECHRHTGFLVASWGYFKNNCRHANQIAHFTLW